MTEKKPRTAAQLAAVEKMRAARAAKNDAPKPPPKPKPEARAIPGIVFLSDPGIFVRWTPLGKGTWRVEANAYEQDEVVPGPDYAHNGTYLHLDGVIFDQIGHPLFDGTPLAPTEKEEG